MRREPFRLAVLDAVLDDLRRRLEAARFPDRQVGSELDYAYPSGLCSAVARLLVERGRLARWEGRFNALDQAMVEIDGQPIHVIVQLGSGADPVPLVLTNGWPSSFVEFLDVIYVLAYPERYGGQRRTPSPS